MKYEDAVVANEKKAKKQPVNPMGYKVDKKLKAVKNRIIRSKNIKTR